MQKDTVVSQADGTTERYEYDALGRVERITHVDTETDEVLLDLDYELGPDGNRIAIVETRPSGIVVWRYKYDALGRLAIERRGETTDPEVAPATWPRDTRYTYDKDSNRLTKEDHALATPVVETYHYEMEGGFRNQRVERISRGAEDIETFTWEDDGRLKTHTDADEGESTTYSWDGQRLTQVRIESDADGIVTVDYAYDQNNDLIRRTVSRSGATLSDTRYLVDRQNPTGYSQVLAEIDAATGRLLRTNTWGSQLRAQSDANSPAVRYPKTDALGSIRRLTGADASGNAVSEVIDYEAFGTPLATQDGGAAGSLTASAQSRLRYAFTGQLRDPATTLQHHRARWLATRRGQWVSHDSVFDFPANSGGAYAYVGACPTLSVDPMGSTSFIETAVTLAIRTVVFSTSHPLLTSVLAGGMLGATDAALAGENPWVGFVMGAGFAFFVTLILLAFPALAYIAVPVFVALAARAAGEASGSGNVGLARFRIALLGLAIVGGGIGLGKGIAAKFFKRPAEAAVEVLQTQKPQLRPKLQLLKRIYNIVEQCRSQIENVPENPVIRNTPSRSGKYKQHGSKKHNNMIEETIKILRRRGVLDPNKPVYKNSRQINAGGESVTWDLDTATYRMPDVIGFARDGTRININIGFGNSPSSELNAFTAITNADTNAVALFFRFF